MRSRDDQEKMLAHVNKAGRRVAESNELVKALPVSDERASQIGKNLEQALVDIRSLRDLIKRSHESSIEQS